MAQPKPRSDTIRAQIREHLDRGVPMTLSQLSTLIGVSERVLPDHLEHLTKSVKREGHRLIVEPPTCEGCGFVFEGRQRFTKPGKCPQCRATRVSPPAVRLERGD